MLQETTENNHTDHLSDDELKLLQEYRSGRLNKPQERTVELEDLKYLNAADNQVKSLLYEVGMLEERKSYILEALDSARKQKNTLLQEVMLKYGIPANQPFKINRDTGVVEFDIQESDIVGE